MALPTFKRREDIPSGFEDEYEEVNGEFKPIDHAVKLKKALEEEREKRLTTEKMLAKAAEASARSEAIASGMTDEEFRKKYKAIEDNIMAEVQPKLKRAEELESKLREATLNNVVKQLFREAGAVKGRHEDFWKMHGDEFDLTADGKPVVKAEPGKDIAKHVAAICKSRPEWMQGTKASGGGAGGSQIVAPTGSGPNGALSFDDMLKNPGLAVEQGNAQ